VSLLQVSAGHEHACGLLYDLTLTCWGRAEYGRTTTPAGEYVGVSAGLYHNCAMLQDRTLVLWGSVWGEGWTPAGRYLDFGSGHGRSCGLAFDGDLLCWGRNEYRQARAMAHTFAGVSAGSNKACGLRTDGGFTCWGRYDGFAAGTAAPTNLTFTQVSSCSTHSGCGLGPNQFHPRDNLTCWGGEEVGLTTPPQGKFTQVGCGVNHACARRENGTLACWGYNYMGTGKATPPSGRFSQVSAGLTHSCGIRENGTLDCWGENEDGQSSPPAGEFTQVSCGDTHTCGVRAEGTVACWGNDRDWQSRPPPGKFLWVSAGRFHTCGMRSDGGLACWGAFAEGQAPQIYISPAELPDGAVNLPYRQQIQGLKGLAPYRYEVREGNLPPGLNLDGETGVLSGTPTKQGTFAFTVVATDSHNDFPLAAEQSYEVTIAEPWTASERLYLPLVLRGASAQR
jgi:hypothetical protein